MSVTYQNVKFKRGDIVRMSAEGLSQFRPTARFGIVTGFDSSYRCIKVLPLGVNTFKRKSRPAGSVITTAITWSPAFWEPAPGTTFAEIGLTVAQWSELSRLHRTVRDFRLHPS